MLQQYEAGGLQKATYGPGDVEKCNCPLCDADEPCLITYGRGAIGVVRCGRCDAVYCNPRAREPEKNYWGEAEKYLAESRLIIEGRARHHRDPNYEDDLRVLARYRSSGRLLDVGTNLGMFLRLARGRGWELHGVEPSPGLAKVARDCFGIDVRVGFLEEVSYPRTTSIS